MVECCFLKRAFISNRGWLAEGREPSLVLIPKVPRDADYYCSIIYQYLKKKLTAFVKVEFKPQFDFLHIYLCKI